MDGTAAPLGALNHSRTRNQALLREPKHIFLGSIIFFKGTRAAVRLCTVAWPVAPTVQTYVQARAGMDT